MKTVMRIIEKTDEQVQKEFASCFICSVVILAPIATEGCVCGALSVTCFTVVGCCCCACFSEVVLVISDLCF